MCLLSHYITVSENCTHFSFFFFWPTHFRSAFIIFKLKQQDRCMTKLKECYCHNSAFELTLSMKLTGGRLLVLCKKAIFWVPWHISGQSARSFVVVRWIWWCGRITALDTAQKWWPPRLQSFYDTETLNHISSSSSRIITPVVCVPYYRCLGDSFVGNVRVSLVNLHNKVHTSPKSWAPRVPVNNIPMPAKVCMVLPCSSNLCIS